MAYKQLKLWFDIALAERLVSKIIQVKPDFDSPTFRKLLIDRIDNLELKDRVEVFADALHQSFDDTFANNIQILVKILGPENEKETGMFKEFYWIMPVAKYIEKYGLNDFDVSMQAIEEVTIRNTAEYAIRPFIKQYPEKTMKRMERWSKDENKHIRRLASEGARPRLPWAQKLDQFIINPNPILPVLNNLKDDTSKYVQKSVANCLNDILKDNPSIAKEVIQKWNADATKERKWIIKHALRNLLKHNDEWAQAIVR